MRWIINTLILVMMVPMMVSGQTSFDLEEAISYAIENAPQLKKEAFNIADAEAQVNEYKAIGLPQVNGSIDYQHFLAIPTQIIPDFISPFVDGRLLNYSLIDDTQVPNSEGAGLPAQFGTKNVFSVGAEANMLLFDGSYLVGLKAVKLSRELAQGNKALTAYQVKNNVIKSYLGVLQAEKSQNIILDNINNLTKTHYETKIVYENGFAEKLDVERLQLSLDNLNRDFERILQLIEVTKNILKFQMSYPMDEDISLSESFDQLVDMATSKAVFLDQEMKLENRPEFQLLNTAESLNKLNVERYKKGYYPSLRGFASYSIGVQRNKLFDGDESGWFPTSVLGLAMSIPIFDGFDKRSKIQRAQIALDKVAIDKHQFEQAMSLEVTNAKIALSNANATLINTQRSVELAEKILRTTKIKFSEGIGSSIEVVQAERELYTAQANHTNAQYDLLVAVHDLEIALGQSK